MHIQNISLAAVMTGDHFDCGHRAILIQITDHAQELPKPKHKFERTYQFEFLDADEGDIGVNAEFIFTNDQAQQIVDILKTALEERRNVIVHCHAGLCRSGAVAEVGIMMGFIDTGTFRLPNVTVKRKMMDVLGWAYTDEEPLDMTDSGINIASMKYF